MSDRDEIRAWGKTRITTAFVKMAHSCGDDTPARREYRRADVHQEVETVRERAAMGRCTVVALWYVGDE